MQTQVPSDGCPRPLRPPVSAGGAQAQDKPSFDETFDIIVVGSGIAGTMTALSAAEQGSKVLMIEKMSRLGGTSRISGLNFACVGSPAQKAKGIQDSPEQLASDMYKVSGSMGDYEKALEMGEKYRQSRSVYDRKRR